MVEQLIDVAFPDGPTLQVLASRVPCEGETFTVPETAETPGFEDLAGRYLVLDVEWELRGGYPITVPIILLARETG